MSKDNDKNFSFKKLTGAENYKQWARDMEFALTATMLWRYVAGKATKPPVLLAKADDSPERQEIIYQRQEKIEDFEDTERRAVAKIAMMCSEVIQKDFLSQKKAQDWSPQGLWDHLRDRYTIVNWASKWNAIKRLLTAHQRDHKNVAEFTSTIRDIKAEFTDLNITIDDMITIQTLRNLDPMFDRFVEFAEDKAMTEAQAPNFEQLCKNLENEELRIASEDVGTANYMKRRPGPRGQSSASGSRPSTGNKDEDGKGGEDQQACQHCGRKHGGECWTKGVICHNCGEKGHIARFCKNKKKKEDETKTREEDKTPATMANKGLSLCMLSLSHVNVDSRTTSTPPSRVIIDCGATNHFFSNRDYFTSYRTQPHQFKTGSGEILTARGKGTVSLHMLMNDGSTNMITVSNVSWAPDLGHNLLSTIPFAEKNIEIRLRGKDQPSLIIYENEIHGLADIIDDQYVLRLEKHAIINIATSVTTAETWHARMGHLGYRNLQKLTSLATGMTINGPVPDEICGPCMKGRQQRRPSRVPTTKVAGFLDEVHSDLGGPLPKTREGLAYYESFRDNATGAYFAYPMRTKHQAFEKFLEFKNHTEKQTGCTLKAYHTDGGGEFNSKVFKDYHKANGIKWIPSAPYTPEQNGVAERLNYTLMSSVRSILSSMKLPRALWAEILKAVVYLKNRSPANDGVTPYERLHGIKPDLAHLRVLGSRAWVHIPKESRKKLDDRSWQGIHVGYEATNQFRIYDPKTGKVHVVRDVAIDENRLYDRTDVADHELYDEDWEPTDDSLFADPTEDEDDLVHPPTTFQLPLSLRPASTPNQLASPPSTPDHNSVGGNDERDGDIETEEDGNNSAGDGVMEGNNGSGDGEDLVSVGENSTERSTEGPRRSARAPQPRKLFSGDVAYKKRIPKGGEINMAVGQNDCLRKFTTTRVAKSHMHMVMVLQNLQSNSDTEGPDEPRTLKEAMARPDWPKWLQAMKNEYASHVENGTWDLTVLPDGRKVITGRWVFRLKKDRFGNVIKYKARWVVHGYKQQEGLDYLETFAAVVKPMSYKCLFALSVKRGYKIRHMDVVTAFLYGFLDEEIYVEQPHLFAEDPSLVCRLRKALYGLKQAPQVWYQTLANFLNKLGLKRLEDDHGVFKSDDGDLIVAVYVDDLLIFGLDGQIVLFKL